MKVIIGAGHFELAKSQAHTIRDTLIQQCDAVGIDSFYKKATFLNLWAQALGYKDWGNFQSETQHAHANNTNNIIISPSTLVAIAKTLRERSYLGEQETWVFESTLFACALEHEKATFHPDDVTYYSQLIGTSDNPIQLELGPNRYQQQLIDFLFFDVYTMQMQANHIEADFLAHTKNKRDLISDRNASLIKEAALDIYLKSGRTAKDIISSCLDNNWLIQHTCYENSKPVTQLRLSTRAINWMTMTITNEYDEAWRTWNKKVDALFNTSPGEKKSEHTFSRLLGYHKACSPEQYANAFISPPATKLKRELHSRIMDDISTWNTRTPVFHVVPRLFLSVNEMKAYDMKASRVTASLTAFDISNCPLMKDDFISIKLTKPYRNKRHLIAFNENGHPGKYVALTDKITHLTLIMQWDLISLAGGRAINVNHEITINMHPVKGNFLYSPYSQITNERWKFEKGMKAPYSFTSLSAISGCAQTQEQITTLGRFTEQVHYFKREGEEINIKEHIELSQSSSEYYSL